MALYFYQAFSKDGKKVTGYLDAPSMVTVKEQLVKQGLFPTSITPAQGEAGQSWLRSLFTRSVTEKDKILFTRQLSILLKSGVPLLQALELLTEHFEGGLRSTIVTIKDNIKEGSSFADALKKFPRTFDKIYVQLVRAGEASGNLEMILDRLTSYMERRQAIAKRVRSALQYPMMQGGVALLVVGFLLVFVVPTMTENFAEQGQELPTPTEILIGISDFVASYYLILIVVGIAGFIGFKYWAATPSGARSLDRLKLRLPLIKYFARTNAVVQFSYTLGMLIEGGVALPEALDIVCSIIDNRILADTLSQARDKIIKQGKITQYLKQTNIFPPIAIYLIKTGEEGGKLGEMLLTVARNYEEELGELADSLSASLGPILLVIMAVIVGFIVVSLALPMLEMSTAAEL
ncbi:MAG TPA: type II secretion system F family protein [Candidatus Limnocylindria bacterium]|nr:type II secretion system F family protein [Candidatus Limnocylindria bacterium]